MVLEPKIKDDTLLVNFSLSSSSSSSSSSAPSPQISTSTQFYLNPQITPISPNPTTPNNFGWPQNHPNYAPNYVGVSSLPQWSSSSNQIENLTKLDLHLGANPNFLETHLNRNPFIRFGSSENQNENKIRSILLSGLEKTHEPKPNSANSIEPSLSFPAKWFHNKISSGSNRVEKNETSRSKFGGLTLNQNLLEPVSKNKLVQVEPGKGKLVLVQPQSKEKLVMVQQESKNELKEPDESVEKKHNMLDLIRKEKSKVEVQSPLKAKGFSDINNGAGEGERDRSKGKEEEEMEFERSDENEEPIVEIMKSWNLRPRKMMKKPRSKINIISSGGGRSRMVVASTRVSKPRSAKSRTRPSSERPMVKEKQGFTFTLSKEEMEHDFMVMTREKPPKKPLMRPKIVQKNLDVLLPGMYLTDVTSEKYVVNEKPPPLKIFDQDKMKWTSSVDGMKEMDIILP